MEDMEDAVGKTNPPRRRMKPRKRWCFRLSNHTKKDLEDLEDLTGVAKRWIWQEEIGDETGTHHIQGAIEFLKATRPIERIGKILGHKRTKWMIMKGNLQDQYYCAKDDTRKPNGKRVKFNWPRPIQQVTQEMLRPNQRIIADRYIEDEDAIHGRKIHWYWEPDGEWGKSFVTKYMVDQMGAMVVSSASKDVLYAVATYVEENGDAPRIVIYDVPRCNQGAVSYQSLEAIKNGLFFSPKFKSAMVRFNSPHIVVFANEQPDYQKLSSDRWVIFDLREALNESATLLRRARLPNLTDA